MTITVNLQAAIPLQERLQHRQPERRLSWGRAPLRPVRLANSIDGLAANCFPASPAGVSEYVDIRLAKDQNYIIADAKGIGFDTTTPGQRDTKARLVRDKDNTPGASDKQ